MQGLREDECTKKKMSPSEKIASVHIDPNKDTVLPELNYNDLETMGLRENKKVLVKSMVSSRNAVQHAEVSSEDRDGLIGETLYNSVAIFKGNKVKPYYTFIKPMRLSPSDQKSIDNGLVLLDVDMTKEYFEVVHWHWINEENLERMKKRAK